MIENTQKRYMQLAEHFYKTKITGDVTPQKIVDALVSNATLYRPDYFRRLRNALAYDQECKGHSKAVKKINAVVNPVTQKNSFLTKKPKEKRVKSVSNDDFMKLMAHAIKRKDEPLQAALYLSNLIGCRPIELFNAKVVGHKLFVEGAKKSNGTRGLDRTIDVDEDIKNIGYVIDKLQVFKKSAALKGCKSEPHELIQARLATATRVLWTRRKTRISLYSFRHQVGSNLKSSGMNRLEVAYLMGHQATKSVDVYGDKRSGKSGGVKMKAGVTADHIAAVVRENHSTPPIAKVAPAQTNDMPSFGF